MGGEASQAGLVISKRSAGMDEGKYEALTATSAAEIESRRNGRCIPRWIETNDGMERKRECWS